MVGYLHLEFFEDWSLKVETRCLGAGSEQLLNEHHVFDVAFIILNHSEEFHELVGLTSLELLSERTQAVADLGQGDFASALLVKDFQALDVVLLETGGWLVGQDFVENGKKLVESDSLLAESLGHSFLRAFGVGDVDAESAEDVAQVEGVHVVALVVLIEDDESILASVVSWAEGIFRGVLL